MAKLKIVYRNIKNTLTKKYKYKLTVVDQNALKAYVYYYNDLSIINNLKKEVIKDGLTYTLSKKSKITGYYKKIEKYNK